MTLSGKVPGLKKGKVFLKVRSKMCAKLAIDRGGETPCRGSGFRWTNAFSEELDVDNGVLRRILSHLES